MSFKKRRVRKRKSQFSLKMAKILLSIFSVILLLNIKYTIARTLPQVKLEAPPPNALKATARVTGFFNGSDIQGTVSFLQRVNKKNLNF